MSLAGMAASIRATVPGSRTADEAVVGVGVRIIGVGVARSAERGGGDRAGGSDRGSRDGSTSTDRSACGVGGSADRTAMIAAMGRAIVARHRRARHCGGDQDGGRGEFEVLHDVSPGLLK